MGTFYYSHDGTGSYRTVAIDRTPPDTLSLWHGYWVLAMQECSLLITHPPPSPSERSTTADAREVPPRPDWAFDIRATVAGFADSITIAAASSGSDGFDGFGLDRPKPPAPPGEHRLRTVLTPDAAASSCLQKFAPQVSGWKARPTRRRAILGPQPYTHELMQRSTGSRVPPALALGMETRSTVQDAAEWQFTVTGGVEGDTVTLSWPELSRLPKHRVAILTDRDTGKRTFMRTRAQYGFAAADDGSSRSFAVTVKRAPEGALLISGLSATPTRGGAWDIGFQLSADAAVTARVYNVAGRRAADVAQGSELTRGRVSLAWNGRSAGDTHVPNGMYLLRVTARTEDGQQASAVTVLWITR